MTIFHFLLPILLFHGFQWAALDAAGNDQFAFSGFHGADLNLDGTATVTPEGLLELTNGSVQLKGHAFFLDPFRLRRLSGGAVQSFSASFVFGILTTYPNLSCHGIAFVIAPSKNFSAALAAQYMGLATGKIYYANGRLPSAQRQIAVGTAPSAYVLVGTDPWPSAQPFPSA